MHRFPIYGLHTGAGERNRYAAYKKLTITMKYFTITGWRDDDLTTKPIYRQYIDSIRHKLPSDLQRLCNYWTKDFEAAVYLNDGRIRSIRITPGASAEVIIDGNLDGSKCVLVHLIYGQVASFQSTLDPGGDLVTGMRGTTVVGYGDHGADEIEVRDDGLLEHRMLFSSGIEFSIVFGTFELQTEPFTA